MPSAMELQKLEMQKMIQQLQGSTAIVQGNIVADSSDNQNFAQLIKAAIDKVDGYQKIATQQETRFEQGDDVSLAQVMLDTQKANLSFQSLLQVRNRLSEQYKQIMNMSL